MDLVDEFITFLWSVEAQRIFVDFGFRSINDELKLTRVDYGTIRNPFDLGTFGSPHEIRRIIEKVISP